LRTHAHQHKSLNTFGRNEIEVAPISSALLRIACLVILYKTCGYQDRYCGCQDRCEDFALDYLSTPGPAQPAPAPMLKKVGTFSTTWSGVVLVISGRRQKARARYGVGFTVSRVQKPSAADDKFLSTGARAVWPHDDGPDRAAHRCRGCHRFRQSNHRTCKESDPNASPPRLEQRVGAPAQRLSHDGCSVTKACYSEAHKCPQTATCIVS
jgi:hypothetical protein